VELLQPDDHSYIDTLGRHDRDPFPHKPGVTAVSISRRGSQSHLHPASKLHKQLPCCTARPTCGYRWTAAEDIELLIDTVKNIGHGVRLTIAGQPANESYRREIMEHAREAGNIRLHLRFIPDDDITALFAACDAVVLPYDIASSLNSGTAILAFSCKKTVICPEIGTITDLFIQKKEQFIFPYRYTSVSTHKHALQKQIEKAMVIHQGDPDALAGMGQALYDHMLRAHPKSLAGRQLDDLYKFLFTVSST
jgi:beta-1,4-mannosyltransferase